MTDTFGKTLDAISEAFGIVSDLGPPSESESLPALHTRLLVTRAAMSRVSELTASIIKAKGGVRSQLINAEGALEDAEADALASDVKKPSFVEDFSSAKERNAKLASKTMEERLAVRKWKSLLAEADAASEYARNRLWELDRAVRDIDTRLRILSFEPTDV